ncbi:DUF2235 domain-containing protein [Aeromonas schubertii]|uniref:DUF2235 domain-containing protein n=1 Tax=Aeromonas TaxID=642 RepID=UPI00067F0632|nr:DUF2235 domain-containing protein [Aeromonas schubertii]KUE79640.1 hypothetical protein ATO46_06360 [Aeromonas schubertii]
MARKLIVCCDGTWNSADNKDEGVPAPTNVFKLFNALCCDDSQLTRYQSGVGSGGLMDKVLGGAVGYGLSEDIRDCYQWLATHYREGDEIFLFGFSRGAFTARSLGGMIGRFGLVRFHADEGRGKVVERIYRQGYREGRSLGDLDFHPNSTAIRFIGVWDTVGALGIPDDKGVLNLFDNPDNYRFHDVKLGTHVQSARHAVSIDEKRSSFTPTLWREEPGRDIKQYWFAGVHSDVGGGYKDHGLADITLKWMMEEAQQSGLAFKPVPVEQLQPDPSGWLHESHVGLMKLLLSRPRGLPRLDSAQYHPSVQARRLASPIAQLPYLPTRDWSPQGSITLDIYARHPWYWTGIYLEANHQYRFSAQGEWYDSHIPAGPDGEYSTAFTHQIANMLGKLESVYGKVTDNPQVNLMGTKRVEGAKWFTLIGALANGNNPNEDGTPAPLIPFVIGKECTHTPEQSGYLYCFANDAWGFYENNRGFVTLTVTRE